MTDEHDINLAWALSVMGDAKRIDKGSIAYLMTMAAKDYRAALDAQRSEVIEECAQWHVSQAAILRAMNTPKNVECTGGMMDTLRWDTADEHDRYAAAIRALKSTEGEA